MDSSFTIKPRPGVAPRSHALRDPVAVREAIDTELDPPKIVTATADGGSKQGNSGPDHESSKREVVIDPDAREALFNAIDVRAEHDEQSPNQALMRQRAYQQQSAPKEKPDDDAGDHDAHADIEA